MFFPNLENAKIYISKNLSYNCFPCFPEIRALHEDPRLLELRHFCVGRFNTVRVDPRDSDNLLRTETTAILKGIAVDLRTQQIFPANFEWGNYADFKMQITDR